MAINKVVASFAEAVADIPDGATLMLDGFAGPGGTSQHLIRALRDHGARDLTIISNTGGLASVIGFGTLPGDRPVDIGILVDNGQVRKLVASFPVSPSPSRPTSYELAYKEGKVELELVPQGTLAERIRAGGAGIAGFYTPTGAGTQLAEGKETRTFDGKDHVLELPLKADFALLRGNKADVMGNVVYRGTSRNFNGVMATAAAVTIMEVDEVVEVGELDMHDIHTPGIYVNRIVEINS
ncbi:MAG: 3-oxoacid CoA-transferase subunit A [Chloroflexi bacterium]|nr:3-oxoacid CoA-transferase subunit A [Chloroflexota bacterium]MDA1226547.1 3-oxoacid CoA-transferase subunit A [Chloroflexota bacterium]